ncbi:phosphoribosylanthranilate isomerase [Clostridium algoriphilum]|uniref:phosphoribosylanthranilate isomerase n=1 Tax=Clostridium algoriphilum TaxID=198347 RepID=UPI001CF18B9F|nr:phosphoribosylanthranilate isomerase [Clostridium algoriphilum]MCB2294998.1 phosphoribosylanthranilate isomerase [Clostridium algoriphilum]
MTKIKICGIRRLKDIEYLNELLPDYAGFVFASSKRQVDKEYAYDLIKNLRESIQKVGVFVDERPEVVLEIAEKLKLQILQFHGHENQEYINKFNGYEIWKALKISNVDSISKLTSYKCSKFLLDNTTSGSGESFDWNLAQKKVDGQNIMLAGGLNSENVQQGIKRLKPYGVDVSSGVEIDGFKDYNKIKEFIKKVREL